MNVRDDAAVRKGLTHLLVGKSIAEILFVVALTSIFYYTAFKPSIQGRIDLANAQAVEGWAASNANTWERLELQLYVDGQFAGNTLANLPRPDLTAAGKTKDEWHGFRFKVGQIAAGEHEARVYVVHESGGGVRRTLQLLGVPVRFKVE